MMRISLTLSILLAAAVLLCSTSRSFSLGGVSAAPVPQTGWRVELEEGKSTRATLSINNRCLEPHSFRIKSEAKYLQFEQPTDSVLIPAGSSQQLGARFDATRLKSKVYRSKVVVECRDCKGSKCTQDRDELPVELSVVKASIPTKPPTPRSSSIQAGGSGLNRTLYGVGDSINCAAPAGNCFDDVVVKPGFSDFFRSFNEAVDMNKTATFFSGEEWRQIFPHLEKFPRQLDMLRGGLPLLRFENSKEGVIRYLATRQSREQIINQTRSKSRTPISGVEFCLSVRPEQ